MFTILRYHRYHVPCFCRGNFVLVSSHSPALLPQNFLTNTPPYSIYTEYAPYTLETYHVFLLADDNPLYNLTDGFTLTPHENGHLCQLKEQYQGDIHTLTEGRDATIQALLMVCEYV